MPVGHGLLSDLVGSDAAPPAPRMTAAEMAAIIIGQ